jgi:hypothetical protein
VSIRRCYFKGRIAMLKIKTVLRIKWIAYLIVFTPVSWVFIGGTAIALSECNWEYAAMFGIVSIFEFPQWVAAMLLPWREPSTWCHNDWPCFWETCKGWARQDFKETEDVMNERRANGWYN